MPRLADIRRRIITCLVHARRTCALRRAKPWPIQSDFCNGDSKLDARKTAYYVELGLGL